MSSLIITKDTSITKLQLFLRDNSNAALHGKLNKDGVCTLYARKGKGNPLSYLFKASKEERQTHARVAILRVLKNYQQNPEMQDTFAEHFKEIETQFHANAEIAAQRNSELPTVISKEEPSERVKMLEDYLSAPLPRHVKTAISPAPVFEQGKKIQTKKHQRSETPKYRRTLYAKDVMRMLAPEAAPINPQKKSIDSIQDFRLLGLNFDEDNKPKTFFREMAVYFQENTDAEYSAHLGIDQKDDFTKAVSPTLWATRIFPTSFRTGNAQQFQLATQTFIQNFGIDCPFKIDKAAEEILGAGATILRKLPIATEAFLQGALKDPEKLKYAANELNGMATDLRGVQLGAELFTNKEFLKTVPEQQREAIFELGKNFQNLFIQLVNPAGPYQALYKLKSLAIESPHEFLEGLNEYQLSSNNESHGRQSQILID